MLVEAAEWTGGSGVGGVGGPGGGNSGEVWDQRIGTPYYFGTLDVSRTPLASVCRLMFIVTLVQAVEESKDKFVFWRIAWGGRRQSYAVHI